MGVFITMDIIPSRIDAEKWKAVFNETVKILNYGRLSRYGVKMIDGHKVYCTYLSGREDLRYPAKRTDKEPEYGWKVTGDMLTGDNMEDFALHEDLAWYGHQDMEDNGADIALAYLFEEDAKELGIVVPDTRWVWDAKTQGRRGHMFLLAIGCLVNDAFPDAVRLGGDISYGQCEKAIEVVKEATGRDVVMPVRFDRTELFKRISRSVPSEKQLAAFMKIYRGNKDDFGEFLMTNFGIKDVSSYYASDKGSSLHEKIKTWLLFGLPFRELISMLLSDKNEKKYEAEDVIRELVFSNVHVEEKGCYNFTESRDDESRPDTIEMLMSRVFAQIAGASNRNIEAYIPLEEMISVLEDVSGRTDIKSVFDETLKEMSEGKTPAAEKKKTVDSLYETISRKSREHAEKEQYDINDWDELFYWDDPEDTVLPELDKAVRKNIDQLSGFALKYKDNWQGKSREERIRNMIGQGGMERMLPESTWRWLIENIMDDDVYKAYYGLLLIDTRTSSGAEIFNVFATNKGVFDYYCKLAK